jgi:oligoendopeptidase F
MVAYELERWSLEDLFPGLGSPEIELALEEMDASIGKFEALRADLDPAMDDERFFSIIQMYEQIMRQINRLYGFASLKFSEDTQDQAAQTQQSRMQQKAAEMDNRTMFFKLWWKGLEAVLQVVVEGLGGRRCRSTARSLQRLPLLVGELAFAKAIHADRA